MHPVGSSVSVLSRSHLMAENRISGTPLRLDPGAAHGSTPSHGRDPLLGCHTEDCMMDVAARELNAIRDAVESRPKAGSPAEQQALVGEVKVKYGALADRLETALQSKGLSPSLDMQALIDHLRGVSVGTIDITTPPKGPEPVPVPNNEAKDGG